MVFKWLVLLSFTLSITARAEQAPEFVLADIAWSDLTAMSDAEPLPAQMRLLGRGFQKRGTDERLAVACINEDCTQYRFIYSPDPQTLQWIGPVFAKQVVSEEVAIQRKYDQLRMQKFLLSREDDSAKIYRSENLGKVGNVLFMFGGPAILKAALPNNVGLGVAIPAFIIVGIGLGFGIIWLINALSSTANSLVGAQSTKVFTVTHDQNNWNWIDRPDQIKSSTFNAYLNAILGKTQITRDSSTDNKIYRVKKKMREMIRLYNPEMDRKLGDGMFYGNGIERVPETAW